MKIENKMPLYKGKERTGEWADFIATLPNLKIGQSIIVKQEGSNYRLALTIAKVWLGKQFTASKEGKMLRIGRIK